MPKSDSRLHPTMRQEPKVTYLPDETAFSLVCRLHRLWGFASGHTTARILFGTERRGRLHDFPCGLERLAEQMEGAIGQADEIARGHTLLRYYLPFRTEVDGFNALESMRTRKKTTAKAWLGLLASKVAADHPLKACPACMRKSFDESGWTYWQLRHQFPGVWICPKHGEPLMVLSVDRNHPNWALPTFRTLDRTWAVGLGDQERDQMERLARLVIGVMDSNPKNGSFNFRNIGSILRNRFEYLWKKRPFEQQETALAASESWLRYWMPLRFLPDCSKKEFPATYLWCGCLNQSRWHDCHPLRILLAIDWMFGDFDTFRAEAARPTEERCFCAEWIGNASPGCRLKDRSNCRRVRQRRQGTLLRDDLPR